VSGFLTNQNTARSDGEDKAGDKVQSKQHSVKIAIETGFALLNDE
jgi:hypothetical protein